MKYEYTPVGTCSRKLVFDIEDDRIKSLEVTGGCPGNLLGISRIVKGMTLDESVGCRIPCGIAARLKGGTQTAGGEGGGVRLAAHQLLAGEFHDDAAVRRGRDEAVVLLGGDAGEGLEPVGKVRCSLFKRPILHRVGDNARDSGVEMLAERHGAAQRLVGVPRQPLPHNAVVEHH